MESIINRIWFIHSIEGETTAAIVTEGGYTVSQPIQKALAEHIVVLHNTYIMTTETLEREDDNS